MGPVASPRIVWPRGWTACPLLVRRLFSTLLRVHSRVLSRRFRSASTRFHALWKPLGTGAGRATDSPGSRSTSGALRGGSLFCAKARNVAKARKSDGTQRSPRSYEGHKDL